jgi:hypothetical protein
MSVHCVAGVGAVPLATLLQVPTVPVRLQLLHVAEQASLQQTPCSQYPDMHSAAVVQMAPLDFCTQTLPTQLYPGTQSALVAQLVLQLVAPQT